MVVKRKLDGALDGFSKIRKSDQLYATCEKSGGLHLAEPSLMAGRLADEIWTKLEIFCRSKYSIFRFD